MSYTLIIRGAINKDMNMDTIADRDAKVTEFCTKHECTVHYSTTVMQDQNGPNLMDRQDIWIEVISINPAAKLQASPIAGTATKAVEPPVNTVASKKTASKKPGKNTAKKSTKE